MFNETNAVDCVWLRFWYLIAKLLIDLWYMTSLYVQQYVGEGVRLSGSTKASFEFSESAKGNLIAKNRLLFTC